MPVARPVLLPAARRLWRDRSTLQLGRPPGPALVLCGIDPTVRSLLGLLDGTRDRAEVVAAAVEMGCPSSRAEELLVLLEGAGLLTEAGAGLRAVRGLAAGERERLQADVASLQLLHAGAAPELLQRRRDSHVVVVGAGRVGATVATLLAAAGAGCVEVVDDGVARPVDVSPAGLPPPVPGQRRGPAAAERVRELAPSTAGRSSPRPDLVVLCPVEPSDLEPARALRDDGTPHLVAEVVGTVGVVGPLVVPGTSPCLRCLDLARTDRDPGWPALSVQLSVPTRAVDACDALLATAVAAHAALDAVAHLEGRTATTVGGTLELALPDLRWRRRSWQVHPDCGCAWR